MWPGGKGINSVQTLDLIARALWKILLLLLLILIFFSFSKAKAIFLVRFETLALAGFHSHYRNAQLVSSTAENTII